MTLPSWVHMCNKHAVPIPGYWLITWTCTCVNIYILMTWSPHMLWNIVRKANITDRINCLVWHTQTRTQPMSSQFFAFFVSVWHGSLSYCFGFCMPCNAITSTGDSFFAFIVHPQPLRCSMHVCVCMRGSLGNPFATSYGHDVLEVWCDLIAHCGLDCCVFLCFVVELQSRHNYAFDSACSLCWMSV